ncbi:MAG: polyprenyl synthetase family protein [Alphaproteobacteria bacterium]
MYKSPAFEAFLHDLIVADHPQLQQAMQYAVAGSGKHIRPWLVFQCGKLVGLQENSLWPIAAAIELVHSYSLVHDDLPAMDNADMRRGKPSCWRAFDEATAILVGDALLPLAFSVLTQIEAEPSCIVKLIQELAYATGVHGMVAGQMFDICPEKNLGPEALQETQRLKTAVLIAFSCVAPALIAKKPPQVQEALRQFGECLGLLYQLTDDIIDAQEDQEAQSTWVKVVGLDAAQAVADTWHQTAQQALSIVGGDTQPLDDFLNWVRFRGL